jgi:hypothetical protein
MYLKEYLRLHIANVAVGIISRLSVSIQRIVDCEFFLKHVVMVWPTRLQNVQSEEDSSRGVTRVDFSWDDSLPAMGLTIDDDTFLH